MSYQKVTGTLNQGGHPGSYNGQDAYNDLLVIDHGRLDYGNRASQCRNYEGGCPTLNTTDEQPILISSAHGHNSISTENVSTSLLPDRKENPIVAKTVVRRLVPEECEMLQGYPPGWTNLGEWVDSKGKLRKPADAPRYKALGNSLCLPFWKVLARKICAQYERDVTMGSLFDGIGGFPVCFKLAGAHPLWASEIDDFPQAVCKRHFGDEDTGEKGDFWEFYDPD